MRILPEEFMHQAPATIGAFVRINHEHCPAGQDTKARLWIKRVSATDVVAYCHHCTRRGGASNVSGEQTWEQLEDGAPEDSNVIELDELSAAKLADTIKWMEYYGAYADKQRVIGPSTEAHEWLALKGFKSVFEAGLVYGTPYIGGRSGLIFPIRVAGTKLIGVQVRFNFLIARSPLTIEDGAIKPRKGAKYVTKRLDQYARPFVYGAVGSHYPVVFVEDYLSARRVSTFFPAVPLYTSNMEMPAIQAVYEQCQTKHARIWLDNDRPEIRDAAAVLAAKASVLFDSVKIIIEPEPTKLTDRELAACL